MSAPDDEELMRLVRVGQEAYMANPISASGNEKWKQAVIAILAAVQTGPHMWDCNICGGQVNMSNPKKPTVTFGKYSK